MTDDMTAYWDNIYETKHANEVSWFEENPTFSRNLICEHSCLEASVLDVGGGASRLVDVLLDLGYADLTVLDLAAPALAVAKARLGSKSERVDWIVADITKWRPGRRYDLWHDRAAFHFLTEPKDQADYVATLRAALNPGGVAIIGTFASDGPEWCSGLQIVRHDAASIGAVLGSQFTQIGERRHEHHTPGGMIQKFQFSIFRHDVTG